MKQSGVCSGYVYFLFKNDTKNSTLNEKLSVKGEHIEIALPHTKMDGIDVSVGPGERKVIKMRILSTGNGAFKYF